MFLDVTQCLLCCQCVKLHLACVEVEEAGANTVLACKGVERCVLPGGGDDTLRFAVLLLL